LPHPHPFPLSPTSLSSSSPFLFYPPLPSPLPLPSAAVDEYIHYLSLSFPTSSTTSATTSSTASSQECTLSIALLDLEGEVNKKVGNDKNSNLHHENYLKKMLSILAIISYKDSKREK
jgi:hypothetical protein